jgi:hypothetical protein
MSTNSTTERDLVAELERERDRVEQAEKRVSEFGEEPLQSLRESYEEFIDLLDRYEENVTGDDGDIQTIIEFQSEIEATMRTVSDEMLLVETFEECDEYLQKKWFKKSDFEHVYEQLEPVADLVERIDERDDAIASYRKTRKEMRHRVREFDERIGDLERLSRLGDADLDAPTERLRDPIETYNDAVTDAFAEFRRETPAREVVDFLETMTAYPLVEFEPLPSEMRTYIREHPPGTEPIPKLLEYADYSRSKLDHYVEEPGALKQAIGGQQTYLQRLNGEPLRIDWPPTSATELEWLCQELTGVVNRFAPPVVEQLRQVEQLPRETEYARLRDSALASKELSSEERERLKSDAVDSELADKHDERDRLQSALDSFPEL